MSDVEKNFETVREALLLLQQADPNLRLQQQDALAALARVSIRGRGLQAENNELRTLLVDALRELEK